MKQKTENPMTTEMNLLCDSIRALVSEEKFEACIPLICKAMEAYPHAPEPHNLFGIVLEHMGDHANAMKHFRAAWALDPTYLPASHNLHTYGTFFSIGGCAFDESEIPSSPESNIQIVDDDYGIVTS